MADEPMFGNIFGGPTEEEMRDQELRKRQAIGLGVTPTYRDPAITGTANAGALLGANLSMRGYEKPAKEKAKMATAQGAKARFDEWNKANPSTPNAEKAMKFQEFVAQEAFKNGLPEIGSPILTQLDEQVAARKKREMELEDAGISLDVSRKYAARQAKATVEQGEAKALDSRRAEIFPRGTSNPNTSLGLAYINDDGSAVIGDKTFPAGSYTTTRPDAPSSGGGGGGSGGVGVYEQRTVRDLHSSAMKVMRGMGNIFDTIEEAGKGGQVDIMGRGGDIMKSSTSLVDNMSTIYRVVAEATGGDPTQVGQFTREDGEVEDFAQSKMRYLKKESAVLESALEKGGLHKKAAQQQRLQSQFFDLAYAHALANSGGGRVSDSDFKNSLLVVGERITQPDSLRQLYSQQLTGLVDDYNIALSRYPMDVQDAILTKKAREDFQQRSYDLKERFNKPFGKTAAGAPSLDPANQNLPTPKTKEERDALPSGTQYLDPTGKIRTKK